MRVALLTLLAALGLAAASGPCARADDTADPVKDLKAFQGTWTIQSVEAGGKQLPADLFKTMTVVFEADGKYAVKAGDTVIEAAALKLDPSRSPKTFDSTVTDGFNKGTVILGIYKIDGDTMTECFDPEGKKRPTEFMTAAGSPTTLVVHKRAKK